MSDDGGGCVVTWEALRLMKKLNLRPRRTVRVVLFTNEENGLRGARAYRERYRAELANHVMMLESDGGVFRPTGFGFTGTSSARATVQQIATLLRRDRRRSYRPDRRRRRHRPERAGGGESPRCRSTSRATTS